MAGLQNKVEKVRKKSERALSVFTETKEELKRNNDELNATVADLEEQRNKIDSSIDDANTQLHENKNVIVKIQNILGK